ncbi:MAG: class I SAM-dependent methyltransferase [Gammaproteobacteria bacterium]|jgi:ubiquinone/menaquinone biosynthesis C-methylase UbiE
MSLKHSYSLLAPLYDMAVKGPLDKARRKSIARLRDTEDKDILINGIGTGLDIEYLPKGARYTGSDITPLMLERADKRAKETGIEIKLECADSQELPFETETFDIIVMHLILAVVPNPDRALQEAVRVLKNNGSIYILDKFLKPGQIAPLRRSLNTILRHIATRTDVVFEEVLSTNPSLRVVSDDPALAGGWFRLIELVKQN